MSAAPPELPRWKCHQEVRAAKILRIDGPFVDGSRALVLTLDGGSGALTQVVDAAWFHKHNPEPGGYFVECADGYCSYSPSGAFEDGHTRLT